MNYSAIILLAAKKVGVSGAILLAICTHETGLQNTIWENDGGTPSYGICMVKLGTAQQLGFDGTSADLMEPKENAKWAATYLKYQYKRYLGDSCKAIAAYNAGSFMESEYHPGMPKNIKYIRCVMKKLPKSIGDNLNCFETKYARKK